jgi:hypothetical protein
MLNFYMRRKISIINNKLNSKLFGTFISDYILIIWSTFLLKFPINLFYRLKIQITEYFIISL